MGTAPAIVVAATEVTEASKRTTALAKKRMVDELMGENDSV
jgi:hypothetical protein